MYPKFADDIRRMNATYELPTVLDTEMAYRLMNFEKILKEEVNEITEIIQEAENPNMTSHDILRVKTGLADLLGDIIVYCASEAVRWNIPLDSVLAIIMSSNFSKLGADGKPIKDERGKFLKGPNYWKPEPLIAKLLSGGIAALVTDRDDVIITLDMNAVAAAAVTETIQEAAAQTGSPES